MVHGFSKKWDDQTRMTRRGCEKVFEMVAERRNRGGQPGYMAQLTAVKEPTGNNGALRRVIEAKERDNSIPRWVGTAVTRRDSDGRRLKLEGGWEIVAEKVGDVALGEGNLGTPSSQSSL
ncbi:hypothetical protein PAAG_12317 [Paracoccidioides lutzii Pb01]|uniref:Uncharacterized protein n=1 Tax=Paracoccidioides lutzii (strain ATCC MYA-826 / Pb01) TaxID=502779 RepID=A0A0A2UZJ8_PARBA|nr:hypothetical protein PAAG_12317 [Paracoccidioides lutzii Pb01]KGQ01006.1 hypothetical protein PAAG_12317 [Paracoccidioides lutzii Pb01]